MSQKFLYSLFTETSDGSSFGSNWQNNSSSGLRVTLARTLRRPLEKYCKQVLLSFSQQDENKPMWHAHDNGVNAFACSCIDNHLHCWDENFATFETKAFFWTPFLFQIIFESKANNIVRRNLEDELRCVYFDARMSRLTARSMSWMSNFFCCGSSKRCRIQLHFS